MPTCDNETPCLHSICGFFGEYRWLSNFYPAPLGFNGMRFGNSEEAYQASKFPYEVALTFQGIGAKQAKIKAAALLRGADGDRRTSWEAAKADVMREVVLAKFKQNPDLAEKLLATGGKYIEETNSWGDVFFGVCNNEGRNMLGVILMETRARIGGTGVIAKDVTQGQGVLF